MDTQRLLSQQQIRRYFNPMPVPRLAGCAVLVGSLLVLIGILFQSFVVIGTGALSFVIGSIIIAMILKANPTDEQYDQWLSQKVQEAYSRGLEVHDIDEYNLIHPTQWIQSFVLPGSRMARTYPEHLVHTKLGKDGKLRFSTVVYTHFFFTRKYVAMFMYDINALNSVAHYTERREAYAYRHIINVTTQRYQDTVTIDGQELQCSVERLFLRISTGDMVNCSAAVKATFLDGMQNIPASFLPNTEFDRKLNKLSSLLLSQG